MAGEFDRYQNALAVLEKMYRRLERCNCGKTFKLKGRPITARQFFTSGRLFYKTPCPSCGDNVIVLYDKEERAAYERAKDFERYNAEFLTLAEKELTNGREDVTLVLDF